MQLTDCVNLKPSISRHGTCPDGLMLLYSSPSWKIKKDKQSDRHLCHLERTWKGLSNQGRCKVGVERGCITWSSGFKFPTCCITTLYTNIHKHKYKVSTLWRSGGKFLQNIANFPKLQNSPNFLYENNNNNKQPQNFLPTPFDQFSKHLALNE